MIVRYGRDVEYDKLPVMARLQWEREHPEADDSSSEEKETFIKNAVSREIATSFIDLLTTIARAIVYDEEELIDMEFCRDGMIHRLFSINVAFESDEYDGKFIAQVVPAETENHP